MVEWSPDRVLFPHAEACGGGGTSSSGDPEDLDPGRRSFPQGSSGDHGDIVTMHGYILHIIHPWHCSHALSRTGGTIHAMDSRSVMGVPDILPALHAFTAAAVEFHRGMVVHIFWLYPTQVAVFLVAAAVYFAVPRSKVQNAILLLLAADVSWHISHLFLLVLFAGGALEWVFASGIHNSRDNRVRAGFLAASIATNLAILAFMLSSPLQTELILGLRNLGAPSSMVRLLSDLFASGINVFILLSKMSLSLDAFQGRLERAPGFWQSLVFTTLFSRCGGFPIDRARETLPQLDVVRQWDWDRARDSFWLSFRGVLELTMYHEIAPSANLLLGEGSSGLAVVAGIWLFTMGALLLFAGVVDVARSTAWILGIWIPPNFDAPFLSTNIGEFWRRWNMTVSSWLNEEVFAKINFQFRHWGVFGVAIACAVTFVGCGLAHSISWSSVAWAGVQGGSMFAYLLSRKRIRKWMKSHGDPGWTAPVAWFVTMNIVGFSFVIDFDCCHAGGSMIFEPITSGRIWPVIASRIDWSEVLPTCLVAFALHAIPHYRGGDFWMSALRPRSRFVLGLGWVAMLLLLNRWSSR
jgi:alginate O-acetyltransferase complex protein AlgI